MTAKNPNDMRVQRTRRWLQNALRDLMQEKRFEKIKVSEIVARADVSRPTFYLHFEAKDHLLVSLFDEIFDQLYEDLAGIYLHEDYQPGQSAEYIVHYIAKQYEIFQILIDAGVGPLVMERLKKVLIHVGENWRLPNSEQEAVIRPNAIDFFAGGIYLSIKRWIEDGMKLPIDALAKMVAEIEITLIEFGRRSEEIF